MSAVFKNIIRDHKLSHKLIPVFNVAPELELACSRVAEFVGERFTWRQGAACRRDDRVGTQRRSNARSARAIQHVAFMQGLFEPAKSLYARRYVARRGEKLGCVVADARSDSGVRGAPRRIASSRRLTSVARTDHRAHCRFPTGLSRAARRSVPSLLRGIRCRSPLRS